MKTITIRKVFIAGLLFFSLGAQSVFAQSEKCTSLTSAAFTVSDSTVKFESATLVAASATAPEHCDVRGTIWPENFTCGKSPSVGTSQ